MSPEEKAVQEKLGKDLEILDNLVRNHQHQGFDQTKPLIARKEVILLDQASIPLNAFDGDVYLLTATGDRTIARPTNATRNQVITIKHKASGGDHTLSLYSFFGGFRFGSTITALTATLAETTDYIRAIYNADNLFWDVIEYIKGFYGALVAGVLDGATQWFSAVNSTSLGITGKFTIEGWFKFASLPGVGTAMSIMSKEETGGMANEAWALRLRNGSLLELRTTNGGTRNDSSVSWTPVVGTWYHIALTWDTSGSNNVIFYINGVQQGSTQSDSHTTIQNPGSLTRLGQNPASGTTSFSGEIWLVRIWKGELRSAANLLAYMCTLLGPTTNLSAEWTLDGVLTDDSGNANSLTNVGSATFIEDVPDTCFV